MRSLKKSKEKNKRKSARRESNC